ncbi:MAG: TonB-dependent receptor [Bacteroides sp.]|jgi:TonB-linked SusC/RagA family outer membrane protein|nr:TonB-dependent receptor [Bacteroides sp.]MCI1682314.1 TonB-dependent receptor [Bacteroides sp.]
MKQKILSSFSNLKIGILLFFLISVIGAQAQSAKTITGLVKDNSGEPVIGVNVTVKGNAALGTITDMEGRYVLKIPRKKAILIYTFIGYKMVEKTIDANMTKLDVTLVEDNELLDEVVVVGYGTMKKKDVTGSVAHIGKEVMEGRVATNLVDFLTGSIAGVNISPSSSAAGGGSIEVRGPASLKASTSPLIVLDGVIFYGNIADINPNDIESMDVLKDASSTAIYGAKGSAGVIMITTKRGNTDKPIINISAKIGATQAQFLPKLPTAEQYIQRRSDYWKSIDYFLPNSQQHETGYYDNPNYLPEGVTQEQWANYDSSFSGDYVETWMTRLGFDPLEIENYKAGKIVDWQDLVYQTGLRQDYNVSASGKTPKTNYYMSLGYTNNEGVQVGDQFRTVRARVNLDTDITKWLKVGLNTQFANKGTDQISVDAGGASAMSPFASVYEEDGSIKVRPWNDNRVTNPLLSRSVDDKYYRVQTLTSTVYGQLTLPYGFSFQTNFNVRYGWLKDYYFTSDVHPGVVSGGESTRRDFSDYEWSVDNMLKWSHTFSDIHHIDATFVYTAEKYQSWESKGNNEGFQPNGALSYHGIQAGINPVVNSNDEMQTGNGLLARLNYSLLDRYLFTTSVRRDGFSAFGQNNPYGVFPAFAIGWRISEEKFMKQLKPFDNLKLRLSWGQNGNRDIGRYASFSRLTITNTIENGINDKAVYPSSLANSDLKWETTSAFNVGLDFGLFNNRLNGTADVYHNKTTNLLMDRSMPQISGYGSIAANLGQINNKGVELTLTSVNINIPKKIYWTTSFIYSTNKNTIKHLYGKMVDVIDTEGNIIGQREDDDVQNGWYIGHGIYDILDYKWIGIWQFGEEAEAEKYGKQPGDPKLLDVNGDGVINTDDKVWLGSSTPRNRMSIQSNLRLFDCIDFSFLLRGEFDYLGVDNLARNEDNRFFYSSNSVWTEYWTPWSPNSEYARLGADCSNPTVNIYKKRNYVKMQNMALTYTFPKKFIKRLMIDNLKLSFNVDNAFVISKWRTSDPTTKGVTPRIWTFGVNMTL